MFRDYARKVYLNRNKPKRTTKGKKTFYMVREVLVQGIRKPITQRITIQSENREEAEKIAVMLNSPDYLNPRVTVIDWHVE